MSKDVMKKINTRTISFRVPEYLYDEYIKLADKKGVSQAGLFELLYYHMTGCKEIINYCIENVKRFKCKCDGDTEHICDRCATASALQHIKRKYL